MLPMFFNATTVYQYVIQINYTTHINQVIQHQIHNTLERRRRVLQPERHYTPFKVPVAATERRFELIVFINSQLMISITEI